MKTSRLILREVEDRIAPMLQNCGTTIQLKKIHAHIIKSSLSQSNFLATKMIDVCDFNGVTDYASLIFGRVIEPNIFLYNALIRCYTHNHLYSHSVNVYTKFLRDPQAKNLIFPNKFTYPFVLKSCAGLLCLDLGRQIHSHICKSKLSSNPVIGNSLLEMYARCDNLTDAHQVFDEMADRDVVTWNTLISSHSRLGHMKRAREIFHSMPYKSIVSWTALVSGYTRIGLYSEALEIFRQMQIEANKPDEISIVSILPACGQLGALELGKWIHVFSDKNNLLHKICVSNALIEMYAKCGSINQARQLFDEMPQRDVISWSTMICGLANHGRAREAIELFLEMERAKVKPNAITFLGLLSACAHAGFLAKGLHYFNSMRKDYFIDPSVEHYGCLVDLFGRLGLLNRAVEFINDMPIAPDATIWGSLLSSSRTHGNIGIAVMAMEHLVELEPDDIGNYVLLSNAYASLGQWDGVSKMRKLMRSKKMKKAPGCSSIEVNNVVGEFIAGNDLSMISDEIRKMLELLASELCAMDRKHGLLV